jgi:HEAT repeat protein
MMRQMHSQDVDDKTFADLVSLMDSPDDSVRAGVAAALGFLGERAKPAIPKLLEILPKVDCLNGPITSADAIRLALKRMGVTPPPRPRCQRYGA